MLDEMTRSWSAEVSTVGTRCQGTDSETRDRDWFSTAKPGDEQISFKEHVDSLTGDRMTLMTPCGIERYRLLWWSSRSRGAWINPCCPEVILYSAFSQSGSVSLRSFLPCV